jgi:hypothetical protein
VPSLAATNVAQCDGAMACEAPDSESRSGDGDGSMPHSRVEVGQDAIEAPQP